MNHATDGLLQAYHDGELDSPALAELRDHLAACALCTQELDELRRVNRTVTGALALVDMPAPMLQTRAGIASAVRRSSTLGGVRRIAFGSLARAAMLLVALAGVLSAMIPDTPLRRALEAVFGRSEEPAPAPQPIEVAPAVEETPASFANEVYIAPVDGRVRVLVHGASNVDVVVMLVDADKAAVQTAAPGREVRFRSANGRIEVSGLATGTLRIEVPRGVANATIEFDGQVYVYKQDNTLQLTGPAGSTSGEEVSFRIGT